MNNQFFTSLNGYKVKDEYAIHSYDSVATMKADTKLKEDMHVKTKGYYSINDGGHGEYVIVNDNNLTPDGGFIQLLNNGLKAVLIEDEINVKQFGAKGDGVTNDSTYIQNAINYLRNRIINNSNRVDLKPLYIPEGVYKVEDKIILSPLVRIKTEGTVIINSYVENDSTLWIKPQSNDNSDWFNYNGDYIDAKDGIQINDMVSDNYNNIGLEIGDTTNVGSYKGLMHATINNLFFKDFNIGIKVNPIHVYCDTFNGLKFVHCKYNFQWGDNSINLVDSGERITFNNCDFGSLGTLVMIQLYQAVSSMFFNNCSFDYGNCAFNDAGNKGYTYISCNQCHFEGCNNGMTAEEISSMPNGIVYGDFKYSIISIANSHIGLDANNSIERIMFKYNQGTTTPNYSKYKLILKNCVVGSPNINTDPTKCYYVDEDINVSVENTGNHLLENIFPNSKLNLVPNPHFDSASTGTVTVTTDSVVGGNKISYNPGFNDSGEIVNNLLTNNKGLKLTAKVQNPSVQVETQKIYVNPNDMIIANIYTKNFYKATINISFYDIDDNQISYIERLPYYPSYPSKTDDYLQPYVVQTSLPERTRYIKVRYICSNSNTPNNVEIGEDCFIYGMNVYKI